MPSRQLRQIFSALIFILLLSSCANTRTAALTTEHRLELQEIYVKLDKGMIQACNEETITPIQNLLTPQRLETLERGVTYGCVTSLLPLKSKLTFFDVVEYSPEKAKVLIGKTLLEEPIFRTPSKAGDVIPWIYIFIKTDDAWKVDEFYVAPNRD